MTDEDDIGGLLTFGKTRRPKRGFQYPTQTTPKKSKTIFWMKDIERRRVSRR